MVRIRIRLTESQHARLKVWAEELGIPLAEAVRRCVEEKLGAVCDARHSERVRVALAVIGKYADPDGPSRVARGHDGHFADAARR